MAVSTENKKKNTPFNKTDASCQVYVMYASPAVVKHEEIMFRNFMYDLADVIDTASAGCIVVPYKFTQPASTWYGMEHFKEVDNPYFIDVDKGVMGVCIDSFTIDMKCMFNTIRTLYGEYNFPFESRVVTAYFDSFYKNNGSTIVGFEECMNAIIKQRVADDIGMLLVPRNKMAKGVN